MAYMVRIIHGQEQDGEGCINRYYYWYGGSHADGLRHCAEQFTAWVVTGLRQAQIVGCVNKYVKVEKVTNPNLKYLIDLANSPGQAGNAAGLPNQNAMKVRYNVFPSSVDAPAKGSKAYAGIGNNSQTWGDLTPAVLSALQNVAVIIGAVLTAPDGALIYPMILKMIDWENYYYIASSVIGAAARSKIGSQDSRQGNGGAASFLSEFDTFSDVWDWANDGHLAWVSDSPISINLQYLAQNNLSGAVNDSLGERLLTFG